MEKTDKCHSTLLDVIAAVQSRKQWPDTINVVGAARKNTALSLTVTRKSVDFFLKTEPFKMNQHQQGRKLSLYPIVKGLQTKLMITYISLDEYSRGVGANSLSHQSRISIVNLILRVYGLHYQVNQQYQTAYSSHWHGKEQL